MIGYEDAVQTGLGFRGYSSAAPAILDPLKGAGSPEMGSMYFDRTVATANVAQQFPWGDVVDAQVV